MDTHNISVRFVVVGVIALALLVPLLMIGSITYEREAYYEEAFDNIASGWGYAQEVTGPLLIVEQQAHAKQQDGWSVEKKPGPPVVLIPGEIKTRVEIGHEVRQRGIFEVPVYQANLLSKGEFDISKIKHPDKLDWGTARLVIGISNASGVRSAHLTLGDTAYELEAGTGVDWLGDGVNVMVPQDAAPEHLSFDLTLDVRGTRSFAATNPGLQAALEMSSTWPHPSFRGRFLPDTSTVTAEGFSAEWISHRLSRGFPASWEADEHVLFDKGVAVELYEPVTPYRSVERGIKYGVLFLAATYLTLLSFELTTRARFHFVQYGVTGLALVLFYLVLLALSEHVAFAIAYTLATLIMAGLTTWYAYQITRSRSLTAIFLSVTLSVYGLLYMLLKMEAYALITGTAAIVLGLGVLMRATSRLNRIENEGSMQDP